MWERQTGSLLCSEWVLPGSSGEAAGLECAADRQNENKKVINMIHQDALVQPNPYWKDCAVHSRQSLALQLAYAPPAIDVFQEPTPWSSTDCVEVTVVAYNIHHLAIPGHRRD